MKKKEPCCEVWKFFLESLLYKTKKFKFDELWLGLHAKSTYKLGAWVGGWIDGEKEM